MTKIFFFSNQQKRPQNGAVATEFRRGVRTSID